MAATGATPNSSFTAYAGVADCTDLRDWRQWADYLNDDNTRPASAAAVQSSLLLGRALKWASGEIESAVTVGKRYKPEDLIELTEAQVIPTAQGGDGVQTGSVVAKELLIALTVDLAFWWCVKRRKSGIKPSEVAGVEEALDKLERLRLGERVFPINDTQDAGLPDVTPLDSWTDPATAAEPISVRASRFFGSRR